MNKTPITSIAIGTTAHDGTRITITRSTITRAYRPTRARVHTVNKLRDYAYSHAGTRAPWPKD